MQLNRREKTALFTGGAVLLLFVVVQWGLFPFLDYGKRLKNGVSAATAALNEAAALKEAYDASPGRRSGDGNFRHDKDFSLYAFLEKKAGEAGVRQNISYMTPSESSVEKTGYKLSQIEMMLVGIDLQGLTRFLFGVETSEGLNVRRLSVTRAGNEESGVDAVFQIETIILEK